MQMTDILPPAAAAKWLRLSDDSKDAEQLRVDVMARLEAVQQKQEMLRDRLKSCTATIHDRTEKADQIRGIETLMETAEREVERLKEQYAQRDMEAGIASAVFRGCTKLLNDLPDQPAKSVTPPRVPGDLSPKEVVARIRDQINRHRADLHRVRSASIMSAEARRLMREQIDGLAKRGAPDVISLVESGGQVAWATSGVPGRVIPDAIALIAWLHRDQLIAALDREIGGIANDKQALTDKDRAAQIGKLTAAILELERQEEAVIEAAEAAGMMRILRRVDADPRAILGIA